MKKIFAVISLLALISCGGSGSSEETKVDSLGVVDTLSVSDSTVTDTLVIQVGGGSSESEEKKEQPVK
jgi:hypothetical protein